MEELMTNLILVGFNLALDLKDTVTHHPQVAANYEAEKNSNITGVRSLANPHLDTIQNEHLTGKSLFHLIARHFHEGAPLEVRFRSAKQ